MAFSFEDFLRSSNGSDGKNIILYTKSSDSLDFLCQTVEAKDRIGFIISNLLISPIYEEQLIKEEEVYGMLEKKGKVKWSQRYCTIYTLKEIGDTTGHSPYYLSCYKNRKDNIPVNVIELSDQIELETEGNSFRLKSQLRSYDFRSSSVNKWVDTINFIREKKHGSFRDFKSLIEIKEMPDTLNIIPVDFFQLHIILTECPCFDLRNLQNIEAANQLVNNFCAKVNAFKNTYTPTPEIELKKSWTSTVEHPQNKNQARISISSFKSSIGAQRGSIILGQRNQLTNSGNTIPLPASEVDINEFEILKTGKLFQYYKRNSDPLSAVLFLSSSLSNFFLCQGDVLSQYDRVEIESKSVPMDGVHTFPIANLEYVTVGFATPVLLPIANRNRERENQYFSLHFSSDGGPVTIDLSTSDVEAKNNWVQLIRSLIDKKEIIIPKS